MSSVSTVYTISSALGLVFASLAVLKFAGPRDEAPIFEFGGHVSVVSIRASNGKYLEVSRDDGVVRATASSGDGITSRFRVHVLSAATVDGLRLAASAVAPWRESTGGMVSASGCKCSGASNEHGFGRYCHPWETPDQTPWCYVDSTCTDAVKGSFGRRHDVCSLLNRFDDFNTSASSLESPDAAMTSEAPTQDAASRDLQYVPPAGCPCSGYRSALGYGNRCREWEYEGQVTSKRRRRRPSKCSLPSGGCGLCYLSLVLLLRVCGGGGGAGSVVLRLRQLQPRVGTRPGR